MLDGLPNEQLAAEERKANPDRFISIVLLTDGENNRGLRFEDFRAKYEWQTPAPVFPIVFASAKKHTVLTPVCVS
ncbi:hypothetical protein, partial [Vibrio vulnificus]|uniref:hypothetical protein n=1 Tax=Vibrio vulnificus TaxID=672 RepID=UPI0039B44F73